MPAELLTSIVPLDALMERARPYYWDDYDLPNSTLIEATLRQYLEQYEFTEDLPDSPGVRNPWDNVGFISTQVFHSLRLLAQCQSCGTRQRAKKLKNDRCTDCLKNIITCKECGSVYARKQAKKVECPICFNAYVDSYSQKPSPQLFDLPLDKGLAKAGTRLFMGVEIELECKNDRIPGAKEARNEFPWLYIKTDGSVPNGLEFVTHPFTPAWYHQNLDKFSRFFEILKKNGYYGDKTCGTHIHLTKKAFSKLHLFKFQKLFYSNKTRFTRISGRTDLAKLRQYASFDKERKRDLVQKAKTGSGGFDIDRYVAINVAKNTVELRFFGPSPDIQTFNRFLQLTIASFEFTKQTPLDHISWKNFKNWTEENGFHETCAMLHMAEPSAGAAGEPPLT